MSAEERTEERKEFATPNNFDELEKGMILQGEVKDIKLYGAFVDVGVERDGLVHISDISNRRINSVSDVLDVGQNIEVWVKDLDTKRKRISLSMKPRDENRVQLRDLKEGAVVEGKVTKIAKFGAFVDIGAEVDGLVHISELGSGYVRNVSDVLSPEEEVQVQILEVDRRRQRVRLSMKAVEEQREEETSYSDGDDVHMPTMMEWAFEQAHLEKDEGEPKKTRRSPRRTKRERDAIISRTLEQLATAD